MFFFGTIAPFTVSGLVNLYNLHPSRPVSYRIENFPWWMLIGITIIGVTFHVILRRWISPEIDRMKHAMVNKTKLSRDQRTDVREVKNYLPDTVHYDPLDYINIDKGIFIGLNEQRQPRYIPVSDWQNSTPILSAQQGREKASPQG